MMPANRLARLAYRAMGDSVARMQKEIVDQEQVNARFGDDALPVNRLLRGMNNRDLIKRKAHDPNEVATRMIAEYVEAMREFEALFEIEEKENLEAFTKAFKRRFR